MLACAGMASAASQNPQHKAQPKQTTSVHRMNMERQQKTLTRATDEMLPVMDSLLIFDSQHKLKSKGIFIHDANGNVITQYDHNWYGEFEITSKWEYTYDEHNQETSCTNYYEDTYGNSSVWKSKNENTYNENGQLTEMAYYSWENSEWMPRIKLEYTYGENGDVETCIYNTWMGDGWLPINKYVYEHDGMHNVTGYIYYSMFDGQWVPLDKHEEVRDEENEMWVETTYVTEGSEWKPTAKSEYRQYPEERMEVQTDYLMQAMQSNDGTMTLTVDLTGDPLLDVIDQQHLLFTGSGYRVNGIYADTYTYPTTTELVAIWENDGTHGPIDWNGVYRFGLEGHDGNNECLTTFTAEDWNAIKEGTVRVDLNLTEGWTNIRVTSGWWSDSYMGGEFNCVELLEYDTDGSAYLMLNIKEDGHLYDIIDQQHLLFTGSGYELKKISVMKDVAITDQEPAYSRKCLWKNDGSYPFTNWDSVYRFSNKANATTEEIYAFPDEDWALIKGGKFYVEIEKPSADEWLQIRVTSGWWTVTWTGNDIFEDSPLLTYETGEEMWIPTRKYETIYTNDHLPVLHTSYNWYNENWYVDEYLYTFYRWMETGIGSIEAQPQGVSGKQMRDGKVIIVVGDKAYNLSGQQIR